MRLAYAGQAVGAAMPQLFIQSAFGALLIKQFGGTDFQAMLLPAAFMLTRALQVPISLRIDPAGGKRFMLWCWAAAGAVMVVATLTLPALLRRGTVLAWGMVVAGTLTAALMWAGSTFWFPLLHDVIPPRRRGRFFGKLRAIWSTSVLLAVVAIALFLGEHPRTWQFQVAVVALTGLYCLRNFFIARVPVPRRVASGGSDYRDWRRYVKRILRRRETLVFFGYFTARAFCAGFLAQPLVLYMKSMGFPAAQNMLTFGGRTVGSILMLLLAGALVDRVGTRPVFLITHLLMCMLGAAVVGIGALGLAWARVLLPAAMIAAGATYAMAGVACTAQLFHLAPDRGRAFFLSLSMVLIYIGGAMAPLTAGWILNAVPPGWTLAIAGTGFDVYQVMIASAAIAMLAVMALLPAIDNVHPRRDAEAAEKSAA